jgi:V/A-type H+-transporting ATPase subunit I
MSIVPLKKVSLCGFFEDKPTILEDLQRLGIMHIVPLRPEPSEPGKTTSPRPDKAYTALRYLNDCHNKRRQASKYSEFNVDEVVNQVLDIKQRTRDATDRRDFLLERIKSLEPWGDFTFPPSGRLYNYRLWFYIVPFREARHLPSGEELPWQIVYSDHQNFYVVVLSEDEPPKDVMPVQRIHTGAESLSELYRQLDEIELEIEDLTAERQWHTRWIYLLSKNLARAEDNASLSHASEQALDYESLFAIQGWIPEKDMDKVTEFSKKRKLALLIEDPKPDDSPPTLLDNPEKLAGGEEVITFYQTPGYGDWDPSIVVFFSFAFFFAMILSDAGYAVILWCILIFYWKKMGKTQKGMRLRTLGAVIATVSLIYGIMAGGYFGKTPSESSWLSVFYVIDVNNYNNMMQLSVIVGVLHVIIANGVRAWKERCHITALVPLGWIVILAGGMVMWFSMNDKESPEISRIVAPWILGSGGLLVFLFNSDKPIKGSRDLLMHVLKGLLNLTNISKIFGDILSYMRLFALGLASASLAATFNKLASDMTDIRGIGLLLAILILILGHSLNLILAVMSGVVHGLRLNFIEFFNWALSEEGYPFQPFSKKELEAQK